jgi:hypothetical protein
MKKLTQDMLEDDLVRMLGLMGPMSSSAASIRKPSRWLIGRSFTPTVFLGGRSLLTSPG